MQHQKQKRKKYETDLTDEQWEIIAPLIPPPKSGGRPRTVDMREVVNATFYISKSGCQWRMLPNDFPKWESIYGYFAAWKKNGIWKKIHDSVRSNVRRKVGKKRTAKSRNH